MASVLLKKPKRALDATEHRVAQTLRPLNLDGAVLLLAVSGGLDSIVLLNLLVRLQKLLKVQVVVAHVHHGKTSGAGASFRRRAWSLVAGAAASHGLRFFSNVEGEAEGRRRSLRFSMSPPRVLKSEADLREFRYSLLRTWQRELEHTLATPVWLVTAHHLDDLLETRLLRLVRGTGGQGLEAMALQEGETLRPLLALSRQELLHYARQRRLKWVEDPSNAQLDPLRNWLRHRWLPALESRRRGSLVNLARSLEQIVGELKTTSSRVVSPIQGDYLDRQKYLELSREEKKRAVASYLRELGVRGYGQSHVEEITKRLDSSRRELKFRVLKWDWVVNAEQIRAIRPEGESGNN
ncbi:MAG: tRNA lysidine(34) synthetase TilS [Bdellovibrionales bacterium]|nr:tRNA lysidine(34) synthetase TilS [Bdellovibrionales bacterium]